MSAYRRFISYMYDYHQGSRGKNCGFVKVEVKNNRCTILFQLKNAPCQEVCHVYLYCPDEEAGFLFLRSLPIQGGCVNQKMEMNSIHIADRDIPFSKCVGILCRDEKGNVCSTCWSDSFKIPEYRAGEADQKSLAETSAVSEPASTLEASVELEATSNLKISTENPSVPESVQTVKSFTNTKSIPTTETPTAAQAAAPLRKPSRPRNFPELWEHMQKEFPSMDPFEDDAIVETIKISPSDLDYLQACKLDLGSNQFLLHGYKNYHHLLLGRIHGQFQYVIGIPGVFDPQEQFMAKMFGFPCFKPIRECRQKNGQFGYWMRCFR